MSVTRLLLALCLLLSSLAYGAGAPTQAETRAAHAPPIEVRSQQHGDLTTAEISGVVDHDYTSLAPILVDATRWCEFLPLSLNIKSCTYQRNDGQTYVTLYAGRKFYQTPDDSHQLVYHFRVLTYDDRGLKVSMDAKEGPYGTRDARIELIATPMHDRTHVRVHVSQRIGFMGRLAAQSYLSTLGKDKVGFTVMGHTPQGEPIYVKGMQGVIERNGVRYYLAMQAYAASVSLPPPDRLNARMRLWFDMTERYPEQLHEIGRDEYLEMKTREWTNQRTLQEALDPPTDQPSAHRSGTS